MATGDFDDLANRSIYLARMNASSSVDIARAKELINEAYFMIADHGPRWEWLEAEGQFTVSSSDDTYSISSIATALGITGVKEIYYVVNDTDGTGPLEGMGWGQLEEFADSTQDGDGTGTPFAFSVFGSKIRFYPKPNKTITMGAIVLQEVSELTSGSDTPLIPLNWRFRTIVPFVASRLLQQRGGGEAVALAAQLYNEYEKHMDMFEVRFASSRFPQLGLDSPNWNDDLPGSPYTSYYDYTNYY